MTPTLLPDTFRQIITNLLNVTLDDKVDNPYLKATLTPLIDTFLNGILEGLTSDEMAERFTDTANRQELSQFLDQAKLEM